MDLPTGTAIDGRYVVTGQLGRGAMATVYRVRHAELGTVHALKVLDSTSPDLERRLLVEGRAQAALRHPNVVAVTDVVRVDGAPGLVMELVEGPTLEQVLARGSLTVPEVDELARGLFAGVAAAHDAELVHRDLKPGNILLAVGDGVTPRVTDFGLAKLLTDGGDTATRSGATLGTPAYMAPEQVRSSRDVDARADVFALGAILYELLAGRRPFSGGDSFATMEAVAYGRYTPIDEAAPGAPARMREAVTAALVTDREARAPSVAALAAQWCAGSPAPQCTWDLEVLRSLAPSAPGAPSHAGAGTFDLSGAASSTASHSAPPSMAPPAPNEVAPALPALPREPSGLPLLRTVGLAWFTAVGVTLGLALPFTLVHPAQLVPGLAAAPDWVGWLGYALAAVALVGAGLRAGRTHAHSAVTGGAIGAFAGVVANAVVGFPLVATMGASPLYRALAEEAGGQALQARVLPSVLSNLFWIGLGGGGLLVGGAAAVGALSAVLGESTRADEAPPLSAFSLRVFASTGLQLVVASVIVHAAVSAATVELTANVAQRLQGNPVAGLLLAGVVDAPVVQGFILVALSVGVFALGATQLARSQDHQNQRSELRAATAVVALAVAADAVLPIAFGASGPVPLLGAGALVGWSASLLAAGRRYALRNALPGHAPLDWPELASGGLVSGALLVGAVVQGGVGLALGGASIVTANLGPLRGEGTPDLTVIDQVFGAGRMVGVLLLGLTGLTTFGYCVFPGYLFQQWQRRRAGALVHAPKR